MVLNSLIHFDREDEMKKHYDRNNVNYFSLIS